MSELGVTDKKGQNKLLMGLLRGRASLFLCSFLLLLGYSLSAGAQMKRNSVYESYIRQYADEAIRQMDKHQIPASIKMAQALLESGAGKSFLATKHNNHFGIKCAKSWQGRRVYRADDLPNDCFRSYPSVMDSYNDHSNFLKQRRYQHLYKLKKEDYKGWAKGLRQAGYATDRRYAQKLIEIIETYELNALDKRNYPSWMKGSSQIPTQTDHSSKEIALTHEPFLSYGLLYFVANRGDTYQSIAEEMKMSAKKLARYNDATEDHPLKAGDIVYLEEKNLTAPENYTTHIVQQGESMHSIAQRYGMKLKSLYKINNLDMESYQLTEGDMLLLR